MRWPDRHEAVALLRDSGLKWWNDNCLRLGASLSYYTIFSLAPLLLIAIAIAALVFGDEIASERVVTQMRDALGDDAAATIRDLVERASQPRAGLFATAAGMVMTAVGASSVFGELQQALNDIWGVSGDAGDGVATIVWARIRTLAMILVIGALLLLSIAVGAAIGAMNASLAALFPGAAGLARAVDVGISFGLTTVMFALLFKTLPATELRWSDVWLGAAFTSLLFAVGRLGITYYLGVSTTSSVYGPAASVIAILAWVYYSAQLFFFGAEFTYLYANRFGSRAAT